MEGSTTDVPEATPAAAEAATALLTALFDPDDVVLFRPIETWTEGGRKRSRVDYRSTCYRAAKPHLLKTTVAHLLLEAEKERLNLFFGVCPRLGGKGCFDLAWQIRTVRALWTDVDGVTMDEAQTRFIESDLPAPSIVVSSGNGAHAYWLLDVPYLIDDVGDPPAVETEWVKQANGRNKPRRYVVVDGDRVYLDQQRHTYRLSPKAELLQDTLAGIAQACGGDHATDLARLLRLPGSLNRKDERNGRAPLPTALVECNTVLRYPLSRFESFRCTSPATERTKQITAMPLPKPRKLSPSKGDKLAELVAACGIAPTGRRSEADFAMCCYAVRNGCAKEEAWSLVQDIGKFAERGRNYFDLTWSNAEHEVRASTYDRLGNGDSRKNGRGGSDAPPDDVGDGGSDQPTIVVDPSSTPVAETLARVTDRLLSAGDCFNRADQLVVIHDQTITPVLSSQELAGLLNQHVEFIFVDRHGEQYKPFTAAYGNTWLNKRTEVCRLPGIQLFTRNPVYSEDFRLVAPGHDGRTGIYYAGPAIDVRHATPRLDALLSDFCFKLPGDRTNYVGVLLTAILMPMFLGSKPAALFNGNQPSLGKTILAQIIAVLRDGHTTETATYNPNDEEFEKRLGAIVRRGATTIIVDNAKARGRNSRIESACLERSITDPVLSFRLLGHSQEIRAENSHIFCITANAPDVSRDLVTRSVVVHLYYEGDPQRRAFSIADPEGYAEEHRLELLGELIGMVERWKSAGMPKAKVHSRFNKRGWGAIVGGILEASGQPDFLANADEAASSLDDTHREFTELIGILAEHPQGVWTAAELVQLSIQHKMLVADLGEGSPRSLATKMGALAGRFVTERFPLADGRHAVLHRSDSRKGKVYHVAVED